MVSFVWVPFRILGGCEIATKVYLSALQIREGGVNKPASFSGWVKVFDVNDGAEAGPRHALG